MFWIENEGQWDGDFSFKCEVGSTVYYVTPQGMTVDFREFKKYPKPRGQRDPLDMLERHEDQDSVTVRGHVVQIHFNSSTNSPETTRSSLPARHSARGIDKLGHYSNYFFGRDSTNWRSRVDHYERVIVPEIWPGIDVEYRADKLGVETVYHVKPGAVPAQIQIEYLGLDAPLRVDAHGNLVLTTSLGEVKEKAPFAFQQEGRMQKRVESGYRIISENLVGFDVEEFDRGKELVVDPLLYGTYLGAGDVDNGGPLTLAPDGGVYVTGSTYALSGFPTTPGAYDETGIFPGMREFVSHFGLDGEFIASTLYGEIQTSDNRNTEGGAYDLAYDSLRNGIWICGFAYPDWPITPDAFDTIIGGSYDGFLLRLSADLTQLEFCSYLGGDHGDQARDVEVDEAGLVYVVGETASDDFPITPEALMPVRQSGDGFLWIYNPNNSELLYSSFFGGERGDRFWGQSIYGDHLWLFGETNSARLPVTENAFKSEFSDTGEFDEPDAFFALLTLHPPTLEYCSYLGGEANDYLFALVEVDSVVYLAGSTHSTDFSVSTGAADTIGVIELGTSTECYVSRLNWRTNDYFGTYFGGGGGELIATFGNWVGQNYVIIAGSTDSGDLPVTSNAFDSVLNNSGVPPNDGFVARLNRELTNITYATYIGGSAHDSYLGYIENADSVWLTGTTLSIDLPVTPDAFQPGDNAFSSAFVQHFAIDTTQDTTNTVDNPSLPLNFTLKVYPNPFNPSTTLSFDLPRNSDVKIEIFNVLGQMIEEIDLGRMNTGSHQVQIGNTEWASGIYIVSLSAGSISRNSKILLIR
ncbi:T9SS type A sorting domain-containing protein [bacterium]|nr:T9SS type A sorting domain-containing protein [bacterium]